jgi:hypothetical protein
VKIKARLWKHYLNHSLSKEIKLSSPQPYRHSRLTASVQKMSTPQFDASFPTSIYLFRRERELRPFYLEQIEGAGAPQRIPLSKQELVMGRADDSDVHLPSQRASRQHAFLIRRGTDYTIRDNDSHNGILLNGIKIHSATLRDGDVLQIADSAFIFHEG